MVMKKIINFLRGIFGFTYLVNLGTKEIHDLSNGKTSCRTNSITKKKYVTKKRMLKMCASKKYNGCSKCNKQLDRG